MDADVREADVLRDGSRNDVEAPLRTAHRFDPRTRLLLEGSIVGTLLRLATPNVLVMFVLMNAGAVAGGAWFGPVAWRRPRVLPRDAYQ